MISTHVHHWHSHEAPEPQDAVAAATAQVARLEDQVKSEKRKASILQQEVNVTEPKVEAVAPVVAAAKQKKRQDTSSAKRRN